MWEKLHVLRIYPPGGAAYSPAHWRTRRDQAAPRAPRALGSNACAVSVIRKGRVVSAAICPAPVQPARPRPCRIAPGARWLCFASTSHLRAPQRCLADELPLLLLLGGLGVQDKDKRVHGVREGATLVASATRVAVTCLPALPRPAQHARGGLPDPFCRRGHRVWPGRGCAAAACEYSSTSPSGALAWDLPSSGSRTTRRTGHGRAAGRWPPRVGRGRWG